MDGIKPIEGILAKLGLPPRPPTEAPANFSWVEIAGRGRRILGLNVLLSVQVAEDVRNTSRNRVVVSNSNSHMNLPDGPSCSCNFDPWGSRVDAS